MTTYYYNVIAEEIVFTYKNFKKHRLKARCYIVTCTIFLIQSQKGNHNKNIICHASNIALHLSFYPIR